jgi:Flp pilus assembly protein TadB
MCLNSISAAYYYLKEYDKAYEYKQLYNAANDSVFNLKKHRQLAEFQGKFDLDKKTSEIHKLASMQQRSKAVIRLQWLMVMVSFLFIVGLGFLLFWLYKKYKQHKRLAEFLSQQKENIELKLKELEKKVPGPYADLTFLKMNYQISSITCSHS